MILHFAEVQDNEAGRRMVDIFAEGNLVLNDFDIWVVQPAGEILRSRG
ncbi:MAG: malectin domain-containing carbohydrate-binding protein [bacterium]